MPVLSCLYTHTHTQIYIYIYIYANGVSQSAFVGYVNCHPN
jgi:hypothetical protein